MPAARKLLLAAAASWSLLVTLGSAAAGCASSLASSYDVVIFSATPAGCAAAMAAKHTDPDATVLLLEPTAHVGGMASPGGIGLRDGQDFYRKTNSTQWQWGMRNAAHYGVNAPVWQPDMYIAEQSFLEMLEEAGVELCTETTTVEGIRGLKVESSPTNGRRIAALAVVGSASATPSTTAAADGGLSAARWVSARYVIDASYEGEILQAAGVSYSYGREAASQWNESLGGVSMNGATAMTQAGNQMNPSVSPFKVAGDESSGLLWGVIDAPDPRTNLGAADENMMAYQYRVCVTKNKSNAVPIPKPPGYDPEDFELVRRQVLAELKATGKVIDDPWGNMVYSGYAQVVKAMKFDVCCGGAPVGIEAVGLERGYATGNRTRRAEIAAEIKYWDQGMMYFWANDPAVPPAIRESHKSYGLCKDEWVDNEHFPPQLYVREAARLVGDKVYTQNSRIMNGKCPTGGCCQKDGIALGAWGYDVHDMQRVAVKDNETGQWSTINEGLTGCGFGFPGPGCVHMFELPFYVLLPKRSELTNLMAPNCPSTTHLAFSAIRVEPTLWQLGQAAGTAAAIALHAPVAAGKTKALQDLNVSAVQESLLEQQVFIHWPARSSCEAPVPPPSPTPSTPIACDVRNAAVHAIDIAGAAAGVNGRYERTASISGELPVFKLDATHQLYRGAPIDGGAWRLADLGKALFYVAHGTNATGFGPPAATAWGVSGKGVLPVPTKVACVVAH